MDTNKAVLVVSFGTLHEDTRKKTIDAIEHDISAAFPDRRLYRAWTSRMILKRLRENGDTHCDDTVGAFERMPGDGINDVIIQPTHMTAGAEFEKTVAAAEKYREKFKKIKIGAPLLHTADDIAAFAKAAEAIFSDIGENDMLALMGHGGKDLHFPAYTLLNERFIKDGHPNICVGTAEFEPGIAPVLERIRERRPKTVYLAPLLVVAGAHALTDMAGESPDSWKSRIENESTEVVCIIKGMGEYSRIREIYTDHAQNAVLLKGETKR